MFHRIGTSWDVLSHHRRYGALAPRKREPLKILIGKYEATIYPEGNGYTGAIDVGYDGKGNRQRIKRKARTKELYAPSGTSPGRSGPFGAVRLMSR
jgi:hypothetical protein